jgi:hypothetical protein
MFYLGRLVVFLPKRDNFPSRRERSRSGYGIVDLADRTGVWCHLTDYLEQGKYRSQGRWDGVAQIAVAIQSIWSARALDKPPTTDEKMRATHSFPAGARTLSWNFKHRAFGWFGGAHLYRTVKQNHAYRLWS